MPSKHQIKRVNLAHGAQRMTCAENTESSYPWLSLERRLPVVMSKGFHNRVLIVRCSAEKLAPHARRAEHLLPATCVHVDVLSDHRKGVGFWVPEAAAYTTRNDLSYGREYKREHREVDLRVPKGDNLPIKQDPGWKWT